MSQVSIARRPWEALTLGLGALLRAREEASPAEAASVRRGQAEMLSLALAVCIAIFVTKGLIAYRDLDNAAAPPQVYDDSLPASLGRVAACCDPIIRSLCAHTRE